MTRTLLVLGLMLGAATSFAQPKTDAPFNSPVKNTGDAKVDAKAHYDAGLTHYNLGEFDPAIGEFKIAYSLSNAPGLLFNIAQSYRLKKDFENASYFYRTYLRLLPDAQNKADVEARIKEMDDALAAQKAAAVAPPRGTVPPDGGKPSDPSTQKPVDPNAQKPTDPNAQNISQKPIEQKPIEQKPVEQKPNEQKPVDQKPVDQNPSLTSHAEGEKPGKTLRLAGIVAAAAGGALIITGAVFGSMASSAASDLNGLNNGGTWDQAAQDKYDAGHRDSAIAVTSFIVGGAALVGGGVLYYLGMQKDKESAVAVVPTAHGMTFAAGWRF